MVKDRIRIEDLAQEVFLRLARAWPLFRGDAEVSTYLYRITINVVRDEWARVRKPEANWLPLEGQAEKLAGRDEPVEKQLARRQLLDLLDSTLSSLSANERTVLLLYHQEERTYDEISRILDIPIGTVRTHLHRGRQRLRMLLEERLTPWLETNR
jgi:RNA polymerase sigma-70 factor, ECF subfamily